MDIDPIDLEHYRRLETRAQAREALDRFLARGPRTLKMFDESGEFWGLERKSFADAVQALLGRGREACAAIVVHDIGHIGRNCPRLTALLARHGPRLRIAPTDPSVRAYARGFVVIDDKVVLRRPDFAQSRVFVDFDEGEVAAAARLIDELLDGSLPRLSAGVTGL